MSAYTTTRLSDEAHAFLCRDCREDVGEVVRFETRGQFWRVSPARSCPGCGEPICRDCADKDEGISERCAACVREESQHG